MEMSHVVMQWELKMVMERPDGDKTPGWDGMGTNKMRMG